MATFTPHEFASLPSKKDLLHRYHGKPVSTIRTPALFIDRAIFAKNCARMHESMMEYGTRFRAHVKTHKTTEGTRLQLQSAAGKTYAIVVSTLMEAWEVVNAGLVKDGTVADILYGFPIGSNKLADMANLAEIMKSHNENAILRIMVDHISQIDALEAFSSKTIWSAFIKIDEGGRRAGLIPDSDCLEQLLKRMIACPVVSIFGFYCHAGRSYASTTTNETSGILNEEMKAVNDAATLALALLADSGDIQHHQNPFVLSVGSTPTAHVVTKASNLSQMIKESLTAGELEVHAGNYPVCDLQQCYTGLASLEHVAHRVFTTVVSYYPGRGTDSLDEALCDAGGIAMSKDSGPSGGFGDAISWNIDKAGWRLERCSQEHGILVRIDNTVEHQLTPGQQLWIVGQHACLTIAAHPWVYVLDSNVEGGLETVQDIWVPWKGW